MPVDSWRRALVSPERAGLAVAVLGVLSVPFWIEGDFWMTVLTSSGILAIGGLGLNLLTGYTGQVSLGHAAFVSIGSYVAAYFGATRGWPLPLWLLAAMAVGAVVGAAIGPFALRFKGNYLVVVTLALIFITSHVLRNWEGFTGGSNGKSVSSAKLAFGVDFGHLSLFGKDFTRAQGLFFLTWGLLLLVAVASFNIVRTRPGRALQAIRDRDVAAEILGVEVARYKIAVFAISSAMASLAGALDAVRVQFLTPNDPAHEIIVSIRYVAVIVVGGVATITGSIVGALFLGPLPELLEEHSSTLNFDIPFAGQPLLKDSATSPGLLTNAVLAEILFGVLLVVFLMFQPRGLMGLFSTGRARLARALKRARHVAFSKSDG